MNQHKITLNPFGINQANLWKWILELIGVRKRDIQRDEDCCLKPESVNRSGIRIPIFWLLQRHSAFSTILQNTPPPNRNCCSAFQMEQFSSSIYNAYLLHRQGWSWWQEPKSHVRSTTAVRKDCDCLSLENDWPLRLECYPVVWEDLLMFNIY